MTLPVEKIMLENLRGHMTEDIPVWLMRQAGRYLPEYRALRAQAGSFMSLCFNPEYAAEVTLQPLRRFALDAAILFSDILVIPHAMGQTLSFVEGEGPRLAPIDFNALDTMDFEAVLSPIYETVERVRSELPAGKTLIGFAGAPWTIACYMIEGRGTGVFQAAQDFMKNRPQEFSALIDKIVMTTTVYLSSQIRHGADCVQIFDSWAGLLSGDDFMRWSVEPTRRIVEALKKEHPDTPVIGFPRAAGAGYRVYAEKTGVAAVGMDPAADFTQIPRHICIQGNLAPEILLAGGQALEENVLRIISQAGNRPFIFNLGHGVIKETPPEHVARLVNTVKSVKRK